MERIVRSWMHSETQTVAAALRTRIYSSSNGEIWLPIPEIL